MSDVSEASVRLAIRALLVGVGQDPDREGLRETPQRYYRFLREWMQAPDFKFTAFDGEGTSEMVVQTGIPFYSLCEHHLLPFFGTAVVAYVPQDRIVGLSKLARAVDHCARGFQNQERITGAVASMLEEALAPKGVAVVLRARHLCMEMRGVRAAGTETTTSCLRGVFMEDQRCRAEFLSLAGVGR